MEIDASPNSTPPPVLAQSPTLESSLFLCQNAEHTSELLEHDNSSTGTIYSSFPNTAPTTPKNDELEFVVTINDSSSELLPAEETTTPRPRVCGPSIDLTQRKIEVVTGVSNSHFGPNLNPSKPHKFARHVRRPLLVSRVRIDDSGHVQPLAEQRRRTGWKSLAMPMQRKPVSLNSIRFSSPPRSKLAPRSVAFSEKLPNSSGVPQYRPQVPSTSGVPQYRPQVTSNYPQNPLLIPLIPTPFPLSPAITLFPVPAPQISNTSIHSSHHCR
ncbi:hypothetical protein niasHS_017213 [Heterodera schachtii]|uniref:Uncharacterized protein n=1 Tax=Heterodera schachtii TaxID=97005 RepID=A0ABD2HSU2_HETSC